MNNRRIIDMGKIALALLVSCVLSVSQAQEIIQDSSVLDRAMDQVAQKYSASAETQQEINRLANEASSTFEAFKRSNDNLESLLVVNAGFRKQIAAQNEQIDTINESIDGVEAVTREVPLLMEKMLASAEQFIGLDYPFQTEQRNNRLRIARDAIDNPGVSIAEKFRQVLVIYQTEASYGRTIETYPATIPLGGNDRDVTIVRIGRVALMYQTIDRQSTGGWDNNARQWVELDAGEYRQAAQAAARVASQLDSSRPLFLPILAPEAAQ